MKEISIEEKVKRYDEAIEKMQSMMKSWETLSYNGKTFLQDIKYIFPELKESEDEKIRESLIKGFKRYFSESVFNGILVKDILAYLEKQGEKGTNGKNREIPFSEQKPAWSEDDEKYLIYNIEQDYRDKLNNNPPESLRPYYNKVISWLKSRIPQKQELSKEDDRMIKVVKEMAYTIAQTSDKQFLERHGTNEQELKNWSLSCSPQNAWKPSEEQIIDLEKAIDDFIPSSYKEIRVSLEKLLKQLKEL